MKSLLIILAVMVASAGLAQENKSLTALAVSRGDPVKVTLDLSESAIDLGLEEQRVQLQSELRLREAMIPVERDSAKTAPNTLYLNINVVNDSVFIALAFAKLEMTTVGEVKYLRRVTTWTDVSEGLHHKSPEIVREGLKGALDRFVSEFLMANPR